jgi:outer membrane lipoprotein-sorting protein
MRLTITMALAAQTLILGPLAVRVAAGEAVPSTQTTQTGDALLAKVDTAMTGFADQTFDAVMHVVESDGTTRERRFRTYQKGGRRLVRFTAPADVKGMAVLVENTDTMYVYLPAYKRVRRIAGHTRNQGFLGSDFSYEDLGDVRYGARYAARLLQETPTQWLLELLPRQPADSEYSKLMMTVDRKTSQMIKLEHIDKSGRLAKTQTQSDFVWVEKDRDWTPRKVAMTDHRRSNHRTEIDVMLVGTNLGLADELFTVRSLERAE